jgi:hypothetical protein
VVSTEDVSSVGTNVTIEYPGTVPLMVPPLIIFSGYVQVDSMLKLLIGKLLQDTKAVIYE